MRLKVRDSKWLWLYLIGAISILFYPVFLQGKVVVPGDIPFTNPFWAGSEQAAQNSPPRNYLLSDQISQVFVWHTIAANALQGGRALPLWNPYANAGQPLVANAQSTVFYPVNLLLNWLTPGTVASLRAIFNLIIAGLFTYLFARTLQISTLGSVFAALAFTLSGPVIVWLGHSVSNVLVTLPMILWAVELIILKPTISRITLLAVGASLSLVGGHPETTFHVWCFAGLYGLLRLIVLHSAAKATLVRIGALLLGVAMGLALGAIQLLPFADFVLHSSTLAGGGRSMGGASWLYGTDWLRNAATGITAIYPNFFGNPVTYNYVWPLANYQNYNEQALYLGLIPLALIAGLLLTMPRRPLFWILIGLALLALAIAWRLPGFELVNHLPIFAAAINTRLKMIYVFFAAVVSGLGFDATLTYLATHKGTWRMFLGIGLVIGSAVVIAVAVTLLRFAPLDPNGFLNHLSFEIFAPGQIRTWISLAVAVGLALLLLWAWRHPRANLAVVANGLIVLSVLELVVLGWNFNPMMTEADILPSTPAVALLQSPRGAPTRIVTTNDVFWPNYPAVYGLESLGGYDLPVDHWYSDLYKALGGKVDSRPQWAPDWPLIDFLNVKYVLTTEPLALDKLRLVADEGMFKIYENTAALPRAFMVYAAEVISDRKAWLDAVVANHANLDKVVYLAEQPADVALQPAGEAAQSAVEFVNRSENEATIKVATDRPGLLVISDLYTPDWQASVDGSPTKLYRANYAFRAISVPAGEHTIHLVYRPFWFTLGRSLTFGAMAVLALALVASAVQSRRKSAPA